MHPAFQVNLRQTSACSDETKKKKMVRENESNLLIISCYIGGSNDEEKKEESSYIPDGTIAKSLAQVVRDSRRLP